MFRKVFKWENLLSPYRFSDSGATVPLIPPPAWEIPHARTPIERDYDRILYASATRRMADKTQVFPLDRNTSIRTRLTHSHEVSNIARSIGNYLVHEQLPFSKMDVESRRSIPAMLAAIGLVHDMGNPPFGHSGEDAISIWFARRMETDPAFAPMRDWPYKDDFLKFEGNAQTLRLLTKLQVSEKSYGLNLTMGTLAASMKYTVGSGDASRGSKVAASNKYGFFESERATVANIFAEVGLNPGQRHPLAVIMEACDDTAYTVIDTEDTVKKRLLTFAQLMEYLGRVSDPIIEHVQAGALAAHEQHRHMGLSPHELDDVSTARFRTLAINAIVTNTIHAFVENYAAIMDGTFTQVLLNVSQAKALVECLREVDIEHAYKNRDVMLLQMQGLEILHAVMDMLWQGITAHQTGDGFAMYAYSRISENYRREFEKDTRESKLSQLYLQCRLLTDMVGGMADGFTLDLYGELLAMQQERAA